MIQTYNIKSFETMVKIVIADCLLKIMYHIHKYI